MQNSAQYITVALSDKRKVIIMTTNLIKYALRKHFTKGERIILEDEIDKLIDDWRDVLKEDPTSMTCNSHLAVLSRFKMCLEEVVGENVSAQTFNIRTKIETSYLPSDDITIIWKDTYVCDECAQRALVGFHYGETDEKTTETFSFNPLIASFEL